MVLPHATSAPSWTLCDPRSRGRPYSINTDRNGYLSRDEFLEVVKQMGAGAANGCKRIGHGSLSPAAADRIVGYAMGEAQAPMALSALPKALLLAHAFVAEEVAMTDSLFDKYDTDK